MRSGPISRSKRSEISVFSFTSMFLSLIRMSFVISILVTYVVTDFSVSEADFMYHHFEGRCVGALRDVIASFDGQPNPEPLAVLEGLNYMEISCKAACQFHSQCWSLRVTVNTNVTKVCVLYGKDVLKPDPSGFLAHLFFCGSGEYRCRSVGPDRCPGFWMLYFTHKTVKAELDEITKGVLSDKDRSLCGLVRLPELRSTECKLACRTERYCSTLLYRYEIPESDHWEMSNRTIPSVCKLLDVDDRFPKYADDGFSALHKAVWYGHLTATRFLLEHAASVYKKDFYGLTPLECATKSPHATRELVKALVDAGAYLVPSDPQLRRTINAAAACGDVQTLRLYRMVGCSLEDLDDEGRNPLHVAVAHRRLEAVKYLVAPKQQREEQQNGPISNEVDETTSTTGAGGAGVNPEILTTWGTSALEEAEIRRFDEIVEVLKEAVSMRTNNTQI